MVTDIEGVVLRIERTSIHDGPGLRTVVFLKGCPLSCTWCSTPESQQTSPERGFNGDHCVGCSTCVLSCPSAALTLIDGTVSRDDSLCSRCFQCVDICPQSAQKGYGRVMTVSQVVAEISKDEIFFFHSGGGVTISGGECFVQPEFTAAILQECSRRSIDTAIETSLFAPWRNIEKSLPFSNTIYVDIKHCDSKKHMELTGVGNELIMANLKKLDQSVLPFNLHLRFPLIPGLNDADENLSALISLGEGLEKVNDIEILPYHRLGTATYPLLGRKYHLENLAPVSEKYLSERLTFMSKQNRSLLVRLGSGYL